MSEIYSFSLPTELKFGVGTFEDLGHHAQAIGTNAFVMLDPFLKDSPLEARLDAQLAAAGVAATKWYDIVPNPRATTCDEAAALARKQACDHVIAIGGGSTIDAAKAVALVTIHGGHSWEYTTRAGVEHIEPEAAGLPLIAVPTSAGTGAEVTPYAVLSNQELKLKATIKSAACLPALAVIDPTLHLSKPRTLTASTGVDTFLHAFEGYLGALSNGWTEAVGLRAMELFIRHIRTACDDGSNIEARTGLAEACYLAGLSLANIGVGTPHSLGQALGALKDTPHGESCAACLIPTIKWTLPKGEIQFAQVARLLDPAVAAHPLEQQAASLPSLMEDLLSDIGLTATFGSLGLKETELEALVDIAFANYGGGIQRWARVGDRDSMLEVARQSM